MGGESYMYGKNNMETYITMCITDSQQEFAVWLRKYKQWLCINLEGWEGEGNGREFQEGGDTCITMDDSCWGLTENNRNSMDLTEAEDSKKRWQEYTEGLYKKDLHNTDNHDGVITHLKADPGMWRQVGIRKHHYKQN